MVVLSLNTGRGRIVVADVRIDLPLAINAPVL
jgi:hypothetical protein